MTTFRDQIYAKYLGEEILAKAESDPSLKPPKAWFEKMKKKIKKSNPNYSEEQVRKTIGAIWYHNLSKSKKSEIRQREGKKYGKAA